MGYDRSRTLTLNADGSFVVRHCYDCWNAGDQVGPEYYDTRTDKGTYVREGDSAIVFTISSSACNADAGKDEVACGQELVGKSVRCAIVDGKVMGYPSTSFAPEESCPMTVS
jgi:hypothetical protein